MRALVISGGGSKGAWAGGLAQSLVENMFGSYDLIMGTSTGSLLAPMFATNNIHRIKKVFTHSGPSDIFSRAPFFVRKTKAGENRIRINHFGILSMFIQRKKTFGESLHLLNLIKRTYLPEHHERLQQGSIDVVVSVSNLTKDRVEYKSVREYDYNEFCGWLWASANVVPFMSIHKYDGFLYADGGFGTYVPIKEAIRRGARYVDVIVLRTEVPYRNRVSLKNAFSTWFSTLDFMHQRIAENDVQIGKNEAIKKHAKLNLWFLNDKLTDNALIFEPEQMSEWWEMGYKYGCENKPYTVDWTYTK